MRFDITCLPHVGEIEMVRDQIPTYPILGWGVGLGIDSCITGHIFSSQCPQRKTLAKEVQWASSFIPIETVLRVSLTVNKKAKDGTHSEKYVPCASHTFT